MKPPMLAVCRVALMIMALDACAGRAPQPVAVVQPQDRFADCAAIFAEVQTNNQKIQYLAGDEGSKVAQNVAAGVVGLFVWPVWFAMDFQGAAGKDVAALQSRQQYLAILAEQRNCAAGPVAPARSRRRQPCPPRQSRHLRQPRYRRRRPRAQPLAPGRTSYRRSLHQRPRQRLHPRCPAQHSTPTPTKRGSSSTGRPNSSISGN
jgi:hypothetical protein